MIIIIFFPVLSVFFSKSDRNRVAVERQSRLEIISVALALCLGEVLLFLRLGRHARPRRAIDSILSRSLGRERANGNERKGKPGG